MNVPQFEPLLGEAELAQLQDCVHSGWLTEGPKSEAFVRELGALTGARHAILTPNGTLALYVALKVRGIGPGDEVIVPDFTFLASASSVILAEGRPVFVDVDPHTFNIDPEQVERALTRHTKAIMPVHVYGQSADMERILEIARRKGLFVIEDAAQGVGVRRNGKHVGTFGDLGCLSFFADKTITTGEGGAILTDDDRLAEACLYFKNQGRLERGSFVHPQLGYNFRLTDLQSALGLAQLEKLDTIIARKNRLEETYRARLACLGAVKFPAVDPKSFRVPFRINILVPDPEKLGEHLAQAGIGARRFFFPLHRQPCFTPQNSRTMQGIQNSIHAFEHGLSLPSSVNLTDEEVAYVSESIVRFFGKGGA